MSLNALPPGIDPWAIGLLPSPDGSPPNLVNPPTQEKLTSVVGSILLAIAFISVVLRLVAIYRKRSRLELDDWLCITAFILVAAYLSLAISLNKFSRHCWDVPLAYALDPSFLKRTFSFNVIAGPASSTPKLAILALYLRLFGLKPWFRRACWMFSIVIIIMYWSMIPVSIVNCGPQGGLWLPRLECATETTKLSVITGSFAVFADIVLVCLPIPVLAKLNLSSKKKVGLMICFTSGLLAVVTSAVSLRYRVATYTAIDTCWNAAALQTTVVAEGCITIMVSCMPMIYSLGTNAFFDPEQLYASLKNVYRRSTQSLSRNSINSKKSSSSSHSMSSSENRYEKFTVVPKDTLHQVTIQGGVVLEPTETAESNGIKKSISVFQSSESR